MGGGGERRKLFGEHNFSAIRSGVICALDKFITLKTTIENSI